MRRIRTRQNPAGQNVKKQAGRKTDKAEPRMDEAEAVKENTAGGGDRKTGS